MSFWRRSIEQARLTLGDSTNARRAASRHCRFRLEHLEERSLLSTYTLSEHLVGSQMHVVEQVNNNPPVDIVITGSTPQPFVLNTDTGLDTVNVLNTSAGVPVQINGDNQDTVNIGDSGSVQGILAAVTVDNPPSYNTVNINDSADTVTRIVALNTVTFNGAPWGEVVGLAPATIFYKYADTQSVHVTTGFAAGTVDVAQTQVPTYISNNGRDNVNVGNAGSVQGILGDLYINDSPSYNTLYIDDSADATARTVSLSTFTPSGDTPWGQVSGLAPANINYEYGDTSALSLTTGTGTNTVNVLATGVETYVRNNGHATVNVGNAGSVQGILGNLDLDNPPSYNTLNINDSADTVARTVFLSTPPGNAVAWGEVSGLAPATIGYIYGDTQSVHVTTGTAANTVDVAQTGVPTYVRNNGPATVNVGFAGSVQGILAALTIDNPPSHNTLNINDQDDAVPRTATLSTYTVGGAPWGEVVGLAPAIISYKYADTSSVHITTNTADVTVNVEETGVPTYLSTLYTGTVGHDTVNVGVAGSVAGIHGALYVCNPPCYTELNIDDSANDSEQEATLSSSATGPGPGPWGSISGLSPASINFAWNQVFDASVNVAVTPSNVSWWVTNNAMANVVGVSVLENGLPVN
jgi:hypothetical protein